MTQSKSTCDDPQSSPKSSGYKLTSLSPLQAAWAKRALPFPVPMSVHKHAVSRAGTQAVAVLEAARQLSVWGFRLTLCPQLRVCAPGGVERCRGG